jgi:3-hydroxyisobutyrate dehydrogenase-like beta-hydroxyacid dehydrogenase
MARQAGTDLGKLVEVLSRSWGASRMLDRNAPNIVAERFGPSPVPIRNLHKDLSIIRELGRELGMNLRVTEEAWRVFDGLVARGRGEWDITAACLEARPPGTE